ncbi:actin-like protein [Cyclospora cayetanensis]|uniref:Actin-like protein n=1 Tax=Cyclospora cayetanensis TaxID=88456 RepID=A0A1D3D4A5_9EIME|nr:actin-like protein [Cyclospora cayetanensis]
MLECSLNPLEWTVGDLGSQTIRLGLSGSPRPSLLVPLRSPLNKERPEPASEPMGPSDIEDAALAGGTGPPLIERGVVNRWDPLLSLFSASASTLWMREGESDGRGFLVTFPPLELTAGKERLLEFLFETEQATAVALLPRAPLSLFAAGHSEGLVVEMGHGLTSVVPVLQGYELPHATFRMLIAGAAFHEPEEAPKPTPQLHKALHGGCISPSNKREEVSNALRAELTRQHGIDPSLLPVQLVEAAKASLLFVGAPDGDLSTDPAKRFEEKALELPDGTVIELDVRARSFPAEVYFGRGTEAPLPPALSEIASLQGQLMLRPSLPSLIAASLETLDGPLREILGKQVVFCRGGSLLPGLRERVGPELVAEMERRVSVPTESTLSAVSLDFHSQREHASWIGGSMLASLSTLPALAISKEMYAEGRANKAALIEQQVGAPP